MSIDDPKRTLRDMNNFLSPNDSCKHHTLKKLDIENS